jgi:hypothetical protein
MGLNVVHDRKIPLEQARADGLETYETEERSSRPLQL